MRILLVIEPGIDGAFRHFQGLAHFLWNEGHELHFAYSSRRRSLRQDELIEEARRRGGECLDLYIGNNPEPGDLVAFFRLWILARRVRPDVIHGHSSKAGVLTRALRFVGIRARQIYTPHAYFGLSGRRDWRSRFYNIVERLFGHVGDSICASSDELYFAENTLGLSPRRLHRICNGIDPAKFSPATPEARATARAQLNLPADKVVLGFMGRLSFQKDPCTFYRALVPVLARHPELIVLRVGKGELAGPLDELGRSLGIGDRIVTVPHLENAQTFYEAVDAVILTSFYETTPLVILEAIAANLPVILSRAPGFSDLREAGLSHCWDAEPEDADGISAALEAWLADRAKGRPSNHRTICQERFTSGQTYRGALALYESVLRRVLLALEPGLDGVLTHVRTLAEYLLDHGWETHLAFSSRRAGPALVPFIEAMLRHGAQCVDLEVTNAPGIADLRGFGRLARLAWQVSPAVVHAHSSKAGILGRALVLAGVDAHFFYTPNAYYGLSAGRGIRSMFFNAIESVFGHIGTTINVSSEEVAFARETLRLPARRLRHIPNSVDFERFRPPSAEQRRSARAALGLPADAVVLGSMGRFSGQKNPTALYRAAAGPLRAHPELVFLHVGQGELEDACAAEASRLGIADRVLRVRYLNPPEPFYHAVDALILTSLYEGLPLVVLEAIATNLPVIFAAVPGFQDIIDLPLSHCWPAPSGDDEAMARKILAWLEDRAAERHCNHREMGAAHFSLEGTLGAICQLYLGQEPAAPPRAEPLPKPELATARTP